MTKDITRTVTVNLPIQRVWEACTTDMGLAEWFWPMWPDVDYRFSAEPGAYYTIRCDSQDMGVHGQVSEVTAPTHIAYSWLWDSLRDKPETEPDRVTLDLAESDGKTVVTLVHTVTDDADEGPVGQGWDDCLERLGALS